MPYSENVPSSEVNGELTKGLDQIRGELGDFYKTITLPQTAAPETQGDEDPGDGVENNSEQEQTSDNDQEYYEFTNLPKENTEFIKNLEQLKVNKDATICWGKVTEEITTFDKIDNITDQNIQNYLKIDSNVPKENYPYIAENFKEIMRKYWAYHPQWMSEISKKKATGPKITIGMADMTNIYMEKNLNIIENLLKKSEDDQRKEIIKNLNNKVLVDFWLKTRLSSLKGEEEGKEKQGETNQKEQKPSPRSLFIQKFLQEIPFDKLDTYFETAKDSVLLSDLRNSLIREQAKKEELFITKSEKESETQKELAECGLLDLFDENKKAKCNKLAELSRKTNPKQEEDKNSEKEGEEEKKPITFDEILDISQIIISNSQTLLKDPKTGVQYCDKQLLSSSEGWAALKDLVIFSEELPQKIQSIEGQKQDEINNNTQVVMFPTGDYHIGGIGVVNASALDIEKKDLMLDFEKKYTKVLLYSGEKPQGKITGKTGLTLDFTQGNNVDDIVTDTTWEQIKLGRRKFKDDRKNDKQNAVGAIGGLIGGTMGTALTAAVTGGSNPWLLSAGYTIGSRLGNGYTQEYRNTGERILQLCGMDIKNNEAGVGVIDKNGVQEPLLPFLRGIGWLNQDYKPVGWGNFFIDLCGDYLAGAASFGLSNKIFGGELSGYLKNTTREIMQEFAIENLFIDTPMEILKAGTKSFFQTKGAENNPGVRNTMINTAGEVYSIENLSYTFFHTVTSCGFLGAVHKPLNYVTNNLTSPIIGKILNTQYTAIQQEIKALAEQMKAEGLQLQLQEGKILQNGKIIDKNSKTFENIQKKIKAIHTKYNEYIKLTQSTQIILQEKMKNLNDPDGIKLKYGLLSPFNTPKNILNNKINEVNKKIRETKDETKIKEYNDLLAEYEHAKEVLEGTYFNGEKHSEFGLETQDAINNSAAMDTICLAAEQGMITDKERNEHIQTLLDNQRLPFIEGITSLDDAKLNAIVEAHMQEGELGDLTPEQIRAKVTILEQAGFTSEQRRFLLEAGFCGKIENYPQQVYKERKNGNLVLGIGDNTKNTGIKHIQYRHIETESDKCFNTPQEIINITDIIGPLLIEKIRNLKSNPEIWKQLNWTLKHTNGNSSRQDFLITDPQTQRNLIVQVVLCQKDEELHPNQILCKIHSFYILQEENTYKINKINDHCKITAQRDNLHNQNEISAKKTESINKNVKALDINRGEIKEKGKGTDKILTTIQEALHSKNSTENLDQIFNDLLEYIKQNKGEEGFQQEILDIVQAFFSELQLQTSHEVVYNRMPRTSFDEYMNKSLGGKLCQLMTEEGGTCKYRTLFFRDFFNQINIVGNFGRTHKIMYNENHSGMYIKTNNQMYFVDRYFGGCIQKITDPNSVKFQFQQDYINIKDDVDELDFDTYLNTINKTKKSPNTDHIKIRGLDIIFQRGTVNFDKNDDDNIVINAIRTLFDGNFDKKKFRENFRENFGNVGKNFGKNVYNSLLREYKIRIDQKRSKEAFIDYLNNKVSQETLRESLFSH